MFFVTESQANKMDSEDEMKINLKDMAVGFGVFVMCMSGVYIPSICLWFLYCFFRSRVVISHMMEFLMASTFTLLLQLSLAAIIIHLTLKFFVIDITKQALEEYVTLFTVVASFVGFLSLIILLKNTSIYEQFRVNDGLFNIFFIIRIIISCCIIFMLIFEFYLYFSV